MVGFALPKLRWLMLGAMAAGGWAMIQEPPKREHWQRRTALEDAVDRTEPRLKRVDSMAEPPSPAKESALRPPTPVPPVSAPKSPRVDVVAAKSETSAVTRLYATEKVRMRKEPSLASSVVTMLSAAEAVTVVGEKGEWRKVSTAYKSGWVHRDFLSASAAPPKKDTLITAAVPRPKLDVGGDKPAVKLAAAAPRPLQALTGRPQDGPPPVGPLSPKPVSASLPWGAMRPARPPQSGDCQCPYDLMLSGKQCADHSAYSRKAGSVACYF